MLITCKKRKKTILKFIKRFQPSTRSLIKKNKNSFCQTILGTRHVGILTVSKWLPCEISPAVVLPGVDTEPPQVPLSDQRVVLVPHWDGRDGRTTAEGRGGLGEDSDSEKPPEAPAPDANLPGVYEGIVTNLPARPSSSLVRKMFGWDHYLTTSRISLVSLTPSWPSTDLRHESPLKPEPETSM